MSEWSDDYGAPVAPPLSTKAPPHNMRAEVQSKGEEEVPEQQAKGFPEQQAMRVLEQQAKKGQRRRPRDLHPRARGSTPGPCLGAWVGIAGLEKCTGRLTHKYPCLRFILLSYLYVIWCLMS